MTFRNAIEVIFYRAYSEMRSQVAGGGMGMVLWVLEPLLYLAGFYIIFSALGLRGGTDAIPFLLIGLVSWKWFSSAVFRGKNSITDAAAIVQQIHVPKYVFVLSTQLFVFYQFLIAFVLLTGFILLYGIEPNWGWAALIPVMLIQLLLSTGLAGFLAVAVPFYPDLRVIVSNGLTLLFFMSGIFFDIRSVPEAYQDLLYLNPVAILIGVYRDIVLTGETAEWSALGSVTIFSVVLVVAVVFMLRKLDCVFPRVL